MSFYVKEIFYSLQGEGFYSGRPAIFCRFTRCNLWSGKEVDREKALCRFCDTDFVGTDGVLGGVYSNSNQLVDAIESAALSYTPKTKPYIVFTGGEPSLQLTEELVTAAKARGFETAIETNGSNSLPDGLDWVTVSPKYGVELSVTSGDELKLVWPQAGLSISSMETLDFKHYYLQPRFGEDIKEVTSEVVELCLHRPLWKLSLQTHKYIGIL